MRVSLTDDNNQCAALSCPKSPSVSAPPRGTARIRVLLADDHQIIRSGLAALLQATSRFEVVAEAGDGLQAAQLCVRLLPDVVLMDISMPHLNGPEATRLIKTQCPGTHVVCLSMHTEQAFINQMLQAGASGFLSKDCTLEELTAALEQVIANRLFLSQDLALSLLQSQKLPPALPGARKRASALKPTEKHLLQLLAEGKNTKEVAVYMQLSPKTVDIYRRRLMGELHLHSLAELTKYALQEGLTSLNIGS